VFFVFCTVFVVLFRLCIFILFSSILVYGLLPPSDNSIAVIIIIIIIYYCCVLDGIL